MSATTTRRAALAYKAARPPKVGPTAAEIEAMRLAAVAELEAKRAEQGTAALAALSGDADAEQAETTLAEQVTALETKQRRLTVAHEAATAIEDAEARQFRLDQEAKRRKRVAKLLDKRAVHAAEFQEHLAGVVRAFHKLNEYNTRVLALYPFEGLEGAFLHTGELQKLVAFEMYRQGGMDWNSTVPSLPGALAPEIGMVPERVTPLTTFVAQANATAIALIEQGRVNPTTAAIENGEDE